MLRILVVALGLRVLGIWDYDFDLVFGARNKILVRTVLGFVVDDLGLQYPLLY